jgi:putative intracellular protease/amidase
MRILMLLTAGRGDRPDRPLDLDQIVEPYYILQDAGAEVVVVSIMGGDPPIHGARKRSARTIAALERFNGDRRARDAISDTLKFAQVFPEDFDGGIWIGALERQAASDDAAAAFSLVAALLAAGKPAAVVPSDLLAAQGPLEGLLIIGDQARSPPLAAKALLAALDGRHA